MLTALLRFSLFQGPNPCDALDRPLSDEQWEALIGDAKREAVSALLYDAVAKLPPAQRPSKRIFFSLASHAATVEHDNQRRSAALHHLADLLYAKLSLPTLVVKGSALARLQPVPLHRECGDNDLYTGADTESVARLMEEQGVAVARHDPRHSSFDFEGILFECHTELLYHHDDPLWTPVAFSPYEESQHSPLRRLPVAQEAFFLAKHTEHHAVFFHESVRLRSVVDWALLLRDPEFRYGDLCALKRGTDVDRFADLLTLYAATLFGLPPVDETRRLEALGFSADDFESLYRHYPARHPRAFVRVFRRSRHYWRHRRQYKQLYGQSMFRRFYSHNVWQALRNRWR